MENLIKKYLDEKMLGQAEFARRVGISRQRLHAYIKNPKRQVAPKVAQAMERASSGALLAYDLIFKKL